MIWILIANRASARILKTPGKASELKLVQEFNYPEGRRQNREIDTDAKGSRYSTTAGRGGATRSNTPSMQMKHGLDPQEEAVEHVADIFARELARILNGGRTQNRFDQLILAAEPGFLGKLRKFLDRETRKHVSATLNGNLSDLPLRELPSHLTPLIRESRRVA